jgi:hypothetical protein
MAGGEESWVLSCEMIGIPRGPACWVSGYSIVSGGRSEGVCSVAVSSVSPLSTCAPSLTPL